MPSLISPLHTAHYLHLPFCLAPAPLPWMVCAFWPCIYSLCLLLWFLCLDARTKSYYHAASPDIKRFYTGSVLSLRLIPAPDGAAGNIVRAHCLLITLNLPAPHAVSPINLVLRLCLRTFGLGSCGFTLARLPGFLDACTVHPLLCELVPVPTRLDVRDAVAQTNADSPTGRGAPPQAVGHGTLSVVPLFLLYSISPALTRCQLATAFSHDIWATGCAWTLRAHFGVRDWRVPAPHRRCR